MNWLSTTFRQPHGSADDGAVTGGWGEDRLLDQAGEAVGDACGGAAVEDAMGRAARLLASLSNDDPPVLVNVGPPLLV